MIHLLYDSKGDMQIDAPKKIIFPEDNAGEIMIFLGCIHFHTETNLYHTETKHEYLYKISIVKEPASANLYEADLALTVALRRQRIRLYMYRQWNKVIL